MSGGTDDKIVCERDPNIVASDGRPTGAHREHLLSYSDELLEDQFRTAFKILISQGVGWGRAYSRSNFLHDFSMLEEAASLAAANDARALVVGQVVLWSGESKEVPAGTAGEVISVKGDGSIGEIFGAWCKWEFE